MAPPRAGARHRLLILGGALPVIVAALLVLYAPAVFGRLSDATYDLEGRRWR